jgi:phosphoribosyl-AMP cyclohydrolase
VNALEEGTTADVGFGKIQKAAGCPHPLVSVVLQDAETKDVLFVGYANREALDETLATGKAVLWSSSRDELWRKGATSGDELEVSDIRVNCEQNALLYLVRPVRGGVCHTVADDGSTRPTCFYRRLDGPDALEFVDGFSPNAD